MNRALQLNVDDLGLHSDILMGVETLWENRCISTVSVFSTSPILDQTLHGLQKIGIPIGVHLILDGDAPVLAPDMIPSLVDDQGHFLPDRVQMKKKLNPQDAFNELSAQIENIQRRGVSVSHLDSHKGICFFNPILRAVYRELGKKYTIPLALPKMFIFNSARKSVPGSSDSLIGVYALKNKETLENRLAAYERMLRALGNGRHYSFSHPAPPTQAIKESLPDYSLRNNDYALFSSPEWKELLQKYSITLV